MPRSRRPPLVGVLLVVLGACSSDPIKHPPPDANGDSATDLPVDSVVDSAADAAADLQADTGGTDTGGTDAGGTDAGADAQLCVADPISAATCAPTYDGQVLGGASRCPGNSRARAGRCGRYLVYTEPFFASPGTTCYYDPTTKMFIAYRDCSDTPGADGCFCRYAGETISVTDSCPVLGIGTPDERQSICPVDGGTASDTRVD